MTRVLRSLKEFRGARDALSGSVGFVPTMGALHEGHASLLRRARAENESSILSIFVNPTQFDDPGDLANYPSTLEADLEIAGREGVDLVLVPSAAELYPDGYRYRVLETDLSATLDGPHRPGHFEGVLTVVMRLLQLVRARRAYFGEKDYQQFLLIRGMADAFFLGTEILPCPTVREADGLAMSSRNRRLSPSDRARAALLPRFLRESATPEAARAALLEAGFEVDYVKDVDGRRFVAATIGGVRLIDNLTRGPDALP